LLKIKHQFAGGVDYDVVFLIVFQARSDSLDSGDVAVAPATSSMIGIRTVATAVARLQVTPPSQLPLLRCPPLCSFVAVF
jgi:hypothetical protein